MQPRPHHASYKGSAAFKHSYNFLLYLYGVLLFFRLTSDELLLLRKLTIDNGDRQVEGTYLRE